MLPDSAQAVFEVTLGNRSGWTEKHSLEAFKYLTATGRGKPVFLNGDLNTAIGSCLGFNLEGLKIFVEVESKGENPTLPSGLVITPYLTLPTYQVICFNLSKPNECSLTLNPPLIKLEN